MLIVRPDGVATEDAANLAPAPAPDALVVGILDNRKDNADRLLAGMRHALAGRAAARAGAVFRKSYVNVPATAAAMAGLAEACNLVLVGAGD